ncbi:MAG: alpha/beta fold hydrolase [Pseudomonadota bacterium]|nr:alpha/beta fold hydrolase [Pseudomonadota bacterium]
MCEFDIALQASDGHGYALLARIPQQPTASLLWLPALGVSARHYLPFAEGLAARGIAVFVHEWRGNGSSSLRASRQQDWNYKTLLTIDLPASEAAMSQAVPAALRVIGGHSLGGQLACCRLALAPDSAHALWLVASGAPYWRAFPTSKRVWLPLAYRLLPWLADRCGALPGRRIGFAGDEARGLMSDWARSAMSGRYAAAGLAFDFEAALAELTPAVRAVVLADDWLAPVSSLRFLLAKMPRTSAGITELEAAALVTRADHFAWMKRPERVIDALIT